MSAGFHKHWYTCFTPSEVNYLQQCWLVYNYVGSTIQWFILQPWHSLRQVSHVSDTRNPAFASVLRNHAYNVKVSGQGDQHGNWQEEEKTISVSVADFYQRC